MTALAMNPKLMEPSNVRKLPIRWIKSCLLWNELFPWGKAFNYFTSQRIYTIDPLAQLLSPWVGRILTMIRHY